MKYLHSPGRQPQRGLCSQALAPVLKEPTPWLSKSALDMRWTRPLNLTTGFLRDWLCNLEQALSHSEPEFPPLQSKHNTAEGAHVRGPIGQGLMSGSRV